MEILLNIKALFSWQKNSDARSSFLAKEKKLLWKKIGMNSWIGFLKQPFSLKLIRLYFVLINFTSSNIY